MVIVIRLTRVRRTHVDPMPPTPTISRLLLLQPPHDSSSTPSPPRPPPHLRPESTFASTFTSFASTFASTFASDHIHVRLHAFASITSSPPSPFPAPGRRTARVRPRAKMSTEHFPSTRTSWTPPGVINFRSFPRGVLPQGSMWNSATTPTGGRILFGHLAVWWPTPTWKAANSASLGPPKRSFRCEEPTQVVQPAAVAQPAEIANHHGGRGIVEPVNGTRRLRQEQPALVRGRCRRCGLR